MSELTVGSLFSGVGGLELGLEAAGMRVLWQVENDDYARRVLERRWPDVPRFSEVRDVGARELAGVDLICGGFPCQDVSLAGLRQGLAGERSTLWTEFNRIVRELRPRWVLVENTPGLRSADAGGFFGGILRDLADAGYDAVWQSLPALAFGAPHLRWRLFIVAHTNGTARQPLSRGTSGDEGTDEGRGAAQDHDPQCHGEGGREGDVADAEGECRPLRAKAKQRRRPTGRGPKTLAYPDGTWESQSGGFECQEWRRVSDGGWWLTEPDVGRVATRVPSRVDRLRCLGNAVVPQIAYWWGQQIIEADRRMCGRGVSAD